MISGHVSGHRALVDILIRLANQPSLGIECVVDTGFAGFLALPPAAVTALQLPFLHHMVANTVDDRDVLIAVHQATIIWNDAARDVEVLALGKRPLLGASLLNGHKLEVEFAEGGPVHITPL